METQRTEGQIIVSSQPIDLQLVDSSQLHAIGHDPVTHTLAIRFKNWKGEPTSLYHYGNFTAEDFAAFQGAESIGKHFGKHIKPETVKHPFVRIEAAVQAPAQQVAV